MSISPGDQNNETKDLNVDTNRPTENKLLETFKDRSLYQIVCDDLNQKEEIKNLKSEVNRLIEVEKGLLETAKDREKEILDLKCKDVELFCDDLEKKTKLTDLKSELSDSAVRIRELENEIARKDNESNTHEQVLNDYFDDQQDKIRELERELARLVEVEKQYNRLLIEVENNREKEIIQDAFLNHAFESDKKVQIHENDSQISENNDQQNDNESRELPMFDETGLFEYKGPVASVSPEIPKLEEPIQYVSKGDDDDNNITEETIELNDQQHQTQNDNESPESMANQSQKVDLDRDQISGAIQWKQEYFETNIQVVEDETR